MSAESSLSPNNNIIITTNEKLQSIKLEDLFQSIATYRHLKINVNEIVKNFEKESITTLYHVSLLTEEELSKFPMPLAFKREFAIFYKHYMEVVNAEKTLDAARLNFKRVMPPQLNNRNRNKPIFSRSPTDSIRLEVENDATSEGSDDISNWDNHNPNIPLLIENKSSIFGITPEDRKALLEIWQKFTITKRVKDDPSSPITSVFIQVWELWPTLDESLFYFAKEAPLEDKIKPIAIISSFIRQALETPASIIPSLQKLAAHHTILGITKTQYEKMAQAFTEAARRVLKDEFSPHLQECLLGLITTLGRIIADGYEEINGGVKSKLRIKHGSKWDLVYTILKPTKLLLFKDPLYTKKYRTAIDLTVVEEITKDSNSKDMFGIVTKTKAHFFLVQSEQKQKIWMEQLGLRLRAIVVKRTYFGEQDPQLSPSFSARGKQKQGSFDRISMSNESLIV